MKDIDWKKLLPIGAALALFFTLALVYFSPVLDGKRLVQGDIKQYAGGAQEIVEHRTLHDGEEPLWTGSMFSGMPAYQISVQWDGNLLSYVDRLFHGFLPHPAGIVFLYLVGMFILLLCLRVDPWLAMIGATAYAFSCYFLVILEAGHNSKANAIGYMPMVFGGFHLLLKGRKWLGAALFALFLSLEVYVNHVQVTYYLGFLLVLYVLAEAWLTVREKRLPDFLGRSGLAAAAGVIALLCNAGSLWSTLEYGKYTTRGKTELTITADGEKATDNRTTGLDRDYITTYSYGKQESFTFLVPNAKGGGSGERISPEAIKDADPRFRETLSRWGGQYWGDQLSTAGPRYAGAVVILLMLLFLFRAEGMGRWWLLGSLVVIPVLLSITSPILAGVLVVGYLLAGIFLYRDPLPYALFSAFFLTLVLSWGKNYMPITDLFIDHLPGYNKFRAITIILVVAEMCAPVLAILYVDRLLREGTWDKVVQRRSLIAMGAMVGLLLIMAAAPGSLFDFMRDTEREQLMAQMEQDPKMASQITEFVAVLKDVRMSIFTSDVMRSLAFVIAAGVLVFLFGRGIVKKAVVIAGIGLLMLVDLWGVSTRYVNTDLRAPNGFPQWEEDVAARVAFPASKADLTILKMEDNAAIRADAEKLVSELKAARTGQAGRLKLVSTEEQLLAKFSALRHRSPYRVLSLGNPFNDAGTSYRHRSVGGYHGAKLKRYQELIEFHLGISVAALNAARKGNASPEALDAVLGRQQVLNMLNTRYLIDNAKDEAIRNRHALGPAWFVKEVKWVADADEEIVSLGSFDPARTALIDQRYKEELGAVSASADTTAGVSLDSYATNHLAYTVRSASGGVVVFSEVWYGPDWKATIDGQPAAYVRANYVLRAMSVPAGEHKVEFRVESRTYTLGNTISLASSSLLILLVIAVLGMSVRRSMSASSAPAKDGEGS